MDFGKIYESIFLRDLMEYFVPGLILLFGIGILIDSLDYNYFRHISTVFLSEDGTLPSIILIISAYIIGHLLTAYCTKYLRKDEHSYTWDVLDKGDPSNNANNDWFRGGILDATSKFLNVSNEEALNILSHPESFSHFREICRLYVQHKLPVPYREFVLRHSVFSRFFQNMTISLSFLLVSFVINFTAELFRKDWTIKGDWISMVIYLLFFIFLCIAIHICNSRPKDLRKKMIKHTLQIWYTDITVFTKIN